MSTSIRILDENGTGVAETPPPVLGSGKFLYASDRLGTCLNLTIGEAHPP